MIAHPELLELQQTLYTSRNPTRRWLHCIRRDWIMDALKRTRESLVLFDGRSKSRALEIGPGSGVYLPTLAGIYDEVVAADIETSFLDQAMALAEMHPNIRPLADDVTASDLPDAHFDLVLCSEVIEHIAHSCTVLETIHRLLKPGGVLVLSTPLRHSPLEITAKIAFLPGIVQVVRRIYGEPVHKTGHINLLTEAELRAELRLSGFQILEHHKSGFYLPVVAEFGGWRGQRLLARIEGSLRSGWFSGLLWTQYYVARPIFDR